MSRFGEPTHTPARDIVKGLSGISYAEAEQFCLDVRRRQVLAMGQKNLKNIIAEELKIWMSETRAKQLPDMEERFNG
jgi:hypothetical protein